MQKIKYRLLAGTLFLIAGCGLNSLKENKTDMPVETKTTNFKLTGKWQIEAAGTEKTYALPQYLVFSAKNIYSIEGEEGPMHPVLDGGWYEYDSLKKELKINTSNDAIKNFRLSGKGSSFSMYEDDKLIAKYKRVDK